MNRMNRIWKWQGGAKRKDFIPEILFFCPNLRFGLRARQRLFAAQRGLILEDKMKRPGFHPANPQRTKHSPVRRRRQTPFKAHTQNTAFRTVNDMTLQQHLPPASHQYWLQAPKRRVFRHGRLPEPP
jgi:hypothetical protein